MDRPNKAHQMTTPALLQIPKSESVKGVTVKTYEDAASPFMCNFSSYGGTERESNGVLIVEDTATVTAWYDPAFKADCRIKRLTDNAIFEIMGTPENWEMRNMFCVFKVRRVKGGA